MLITKLKYPKAQIHISVSEILQEYNCSQDVFLKLAIYDFINQMVFKGFLIRMDGSRHCVLMAANITKGDTTRHYTEHGIILK